MRLNSILGLTALCLAGCRGIDSAAFDVSLDCSPVVYGGCEREDGLAAVRIERIRTCGGARPSGVLLAADASAHAYADAIMAALELHNRFASYSPSRQFAELKSAISDAGASEEPPSHIAVFVYDSKSPESVQFSAKSVLQKLQGKDSYWTYSNIVFLLDAGLRRQEEHNGKR